MAMQLPQRGQPIDYSYLYQLVEQVNSLSAELARNKSSNQIDNGEVSQARDKVGISETKIVAKKHKVGTHKVKDAKDSIPFTITFDGFLYAPVVTITPQASDKAQSSEMDIYLVIKNITPNSVTGTIQLNAGAKETADISLNMIAVGVRR